MSDRGPMLSCLLVLQLTACVDSPSSIGSDIGATPDLSESGSTDSGHTAESELAAADAGQSGEAPLVDAAANDDVNVVPDVILQRPADAATDGRSWPADVGCSDRCTPLARRCENNAIMLCVSANLGCPRWIELLQCHEDQCSDGACLPRVVDCRRWSNWHCEASGSGNGCSASCANREEISCASGRQCLCDVHWFGGDNLNDGCEKCRRALARIPAACLR